MTVARVCAFALVAATTIGCAALAAEDAPKPVSPGQQAADNDFGKLSSDGMKAFGDLRMARLAIFNGETDKAKTLAQDAQTSLGKAKTDDTVFMKAESDLKPHPGAGQDGTAKAAPSTTPVAWIPVDGVMTLGENYVETPRKAAGVAKADAQLKGGDSKKAMETLKLSNVDVNFVEEVAPLAATISGVDKAVQLLDQGHYFEANQALKSVQDGTRFEDVALKSGGKPGAAKHS